MLVIETTYCSDCPTGCALCTSLLLCSQCSTGYFLDGTLCPTTCPSGEYGDVSTNTCLTSPTLTFTSGTGVFFLASTIVLNWNLPVSFTAANFTVTTAFYDVTNGGITTNLRIGSLLTGVTSFLNADKTSIGISTAQLLEDTQYKITVQVVSARPDLHNGLTVSEDGILYIDHPRAYVITIDSLDVLAGDYDIYISSTEGDTVLTADYYATLNGVTSIIGTQATPDTLKMSFNIAPSYTQTSVAITATVTRVDGAVIGTSSILPLIKNQYPNCHAYCLKCTVNNDNTKCIGCSTPTVQYVAPSSCLGIDYC